MWLFALSGHLRQHPIWQRDLVRWQLVDLIGLYWVLSPHTPDAVNSYLCGWITYRGCLENLIRCDKLLMSCWADGCDLRTRIQLKGHWLPFYLNSSRPLHCLIGRCKVIQKGCVRINVQGHKGISDFHVIGSYRLWQAHDSIMLFTLASVASLAGHLSLGWDSRPYRMHNCLEAVALGCIWDFITAILLGSSAAASLSVLCCLRTAYIIVLAFSNMRPSSVGAQRVRYYDFNYKSFGSFLMHCSRNFRPVHRVLLCSARRSPYSWFL